MTTLLWDVGTIEYKLSRRPLVDAYSTVLFSSHKYRRSVGRLVVKGKINVHNTEFLPSVRGLPLLVLTYFEKRAQTKKTPEKVALCSR